MYAAAKSMCLHSRIKDLLNHLGTRFLFFLFFVFCFLFFFARPHKLSGDS